MRKVSTGWPTAEEVRLMLYDAGEGGHAYETVKMELGENGTWMTSVDKDLLGKYYACLLYTSSSNMPPL